MMADPTDNERKPSVTKEIVIRNGEEYIVTDEHVVGNISYRTLEPLHERPMRKRRPSHD